MGDLRIIGLVEVNSIQYILMLHVYNFCYQLYIDYLYYNNSPNNVLCAS